MTQREKQLRQRLAILFQQLEVYNRFQDDFEKALGKRGIEEWLNKVLDEIKEIEKELTKK